MVFWGAAAAAGEAGEEGEVLAKLVVPQAKAPPPWTLRGGFSFAKVVMGERLAAKATEAAKKAMM